MSTIELKQRLITQIQLIEKVDILEDVSRLLEVDLPDQKILYLNDEQKQIISEARAQISQGIFFSNEDVEIDTEEWLKE
ncbi:MAG: hypothetical protein HYZ33_00460 [Ignavibacteriales bacterium]|nr:hypothetical protein [Ignavibacteriales bacterium]